MAASLDAAPPPPAVGPEEARGGAAEQARTLIGALNLLSRNLPLPPAVLRAVSSIYHDGGAGEEGEQKEGEDELPVGDGGGEGNPRTPAVRPSQAGACQRVLTPVLVGSSRDAPMAYYKNNQTGQSFLSYISAKILDNIQVSMRNVHMIYVDCHKDQAKRFQA